MSDEPQTYTEIREGREFKVTVLPDEVPPPNRSKRTHVTTETRAAKRAEKKAQKEKSE
jgi:hypothetical protein